MKESDVISYSPSVGREETKILGSKRKAPIKRSNDFLW
jgi:hypothetical protein